MRILGRCDGSDGPGMAIALSAGDLERLRMAVEDELEEGAVPDPTKLVELSAHLADAQRRLRGDEVQR